MRKYEKQLDLCEFFGVKEGEMFKVEKYQCCKTSFDIDYSYRINNNDLEVKKDYDEEWKLSRLGFNEVKSTTKNKSYPEKAKQLLRLLPDEYKDGYVAMDDRIGDRIGYCVYAYNSKPTKGECEWHVKDGAHLDLGSFKHLFTFLSFSDAEPIKISDILESEE